MDEILTPKGFKASATAAGLKKHSGLDTALIFSEFPAAAAGVFTRNAVKAAPVIVTRDNLKGGRARAIFVNAGNANACTGQEGLKNAALTAQMTARELGIDSREVMVASTGVIGQQLRMDLVERAVSKLARSLSPEGLGEAAKAIMTTDSFPKISSRRGKVGERDFLITGIAKGAGMIMPDMATMLCFVISDAEVDGALLASALRDAVGKTFNKITVDGDTSTNDMVLLLANGASGAKIGDDISLFGDLLSEVMGDLASMIVRDGEGATKLVTIILEGAATPSDAAKAVRTVATSSLVKTAFYGQDPNWGRIMAALGRAGITMDESKVDIWIDDVKIVEGGLSKGTEAEAAASLCMKNRQFKVVIGLNQGSHGDTILTSDLTHEYVSINAAYRT
jgi:glutamate N-acetyltransferase/amino-acid N-acetyltransferase